MSGIPFVFTQAMKEALRALGYNDNEIARFTPEEALKILLTPAPRVVREFMQAIVAQARAALGTNPNPGLLQLTRLHPTSESLVPSRFALDGVERMIETAIGDSSAGHNVYIEGRTVPVSLHGNVRGTLAETVAVFALVIDSDADKGMGWTPPAAVRPSMTVETSPGNFQFWLFLRTAINPMLAQKLGERIRRAVESDHDTGNPTQPYRIAGTVNYPNDKKVMRGRTTAWTRLIALDPAMLWTPEDIERAFPEAPIPAAKSAGSNGGAQATAAGDVNEADIPAETLRVIHNGPSKGGKRDRSLAFWNVVMVLKSLGFTPAGILELFERHPNGIGSKYEGRLQREIERAYDKIEDASAPVSKPAPAPAPVSAPAPTPGAMSQALADVHAVFKKWLGNDYDTDVLDAVLAAGAAERLTGDPLWLLVISGPGNAKTETVQALVGAGALVTSTITSEGALLSAAPRRGQATGGLLCKLGARGLLVIKDVTSLLAMDSRARGLILAALREVYDGKWERNVGVSGGRTLTWTGRVAVVGACTTAWDTAHSVIAVMGDRFVVVRADSEDARTRIRAAEMAVGNTGQETGMRAELAAAISGLVANASTAEHRLAPAETAQLIKLANIVTWARTGTERDYRGNVTDAHASEMPTRFAKQLTQLVRGAVAIGMPPAAAMRLATRCARDTIPPLRRRILLDLAAHPESRPREVARRIARPRTTVVNELRALRMLHALDCDEQDVVQGGKERTYEQYRLAAALDRDLLLSM